MHIKEKTNLIFKERYMKALLFWGMGSDSVSDYDLKTNLKKNSFFINTVVRFVGDEKYKYSWEDLREQASKLNKKYKNRPKIIENVSSKLSLKQIDFNLNDILNQQENTINKLQKITESEKMSFQSFMETISIIKTLSPHERDEVYSWYNLNYLEKLFLEIPLGVKKWCGGFSSKKMAQKKWMEYQQLLSKASSMSHEIKTQQDKFFSCKKIYSKIKRKEHLEKDVKKKRKLINKIRMKLNYLIDNDFKNDDEILMTYYSIFYFIDNFYNEEWEEGSKMFYYLFDTPERRWDKTLGENKEMKELFNRGLF